MPRHRGTNLERFIFSVPFELFLRYFEVLQGQTDPPQEWRFDSPDAMKEWLAAPDNAEASGVVVEEWNRVNDVCVHAGRHLLRAYDRSPVPCDQDRPLEELAMRLFLEDRKAFDYAWSYYLLQTSKARVSQYRFPSGELEFSAKDEVDLETFLTDMFHQQKMGANCRVRVNRDNSGVIVLVSRGTYMRTVMRWKGTQVVFETFRPAIEDVMTYETAAQRLSVRPGFNRDRDLYVRAIARFLAGDQDMADRALKEPMFDLSPIRNDKFSYRGGGVIQRVVLREAELILPVLGKTVLIIKSNDVARTVKEDFPELALSRGDLRRVRLLFDVRPDPQGKTFSVVFEIEPPAFSDFSVKAQAAHIDRYLQEQGVKLA
jgi:hypothetical protein